MILSGIWTLMALATPYGQRGWSARNAAGEAVECDAEDAARWSVFGHIKRRETDSLLVRDCFAAALAHGMPLILQRWLDAFEGSGKWSRAASLAAFDFARRTVAAANSGSRSGCTGQ